MSLLRWLACILGGSLAGGILGGLILLIGQLLLGHWKLTSGIVLYFAATFLVVYSVGIGLGLAPQTNRLAKWLMIGPHWVAGVLFAFPALLLAIFSPDSLPAIATSKGISQSLSLRWEVLIWTLAYLGSLVHVSSQQPDELVPENPKPRRAAKNFWRLYGRALGSPEPAERVRAADQALAQIDTFDSWPIPASTLSERVARGKLLGSKAKAYVDLQHLDPPTYSARSIATHEQARQYLREDDGEAWATFMMNFSIAHAERPTGDRGENLERAIECVEAALSVLDRRSHPDTWRRAMANLAGFLGERQQGVPADNLERALAVQQEMLDTTSQDSDPEMWAKARAALGTLYLKRIHGSKFDNVRIGVELLEESLEAMPRSKAPLEWAHTATTLAASYGKSNRRLDRESWKRASELLEGAIEVYEAHGRPDRWADAMMNLGNLWLSGGADNRPQEIENAISCFEKALTVFTADGHPHDHAMVMTNLATALLKRRTPDRRESFDDSIAAARKGAAAVDRRTSPADWVLACGNLAEALIQTHGDGRSAAIEEAIEYLGKALSKLSPETTPDPWAWIRGMLANAYAARLEGPRAENLEEAIRLQREALEVIDAERHPKAWVGAHHNLAVSYLERLMGSKADNIEMVIALVERALVLAPGFRSPEVRSELLEILGEAYLDRVRGEPKDNVDHALRAFQSAKKLRPREDGEPEWQRLDQKHLRARIKGTNLGIFEDESELTSPSDELKILEANAESISPQEHLPTWINAQIARGDMYTRIAPKSGDEMRDFVPEVRRNMRRAIEIYRGALQGLSRDTEPGLWAVLQKRVFVGYRLLHLFEDPRWGPEGADGESSPERRASSSLDEAAEAMADALDTAPFDQRQLLEGYLELGRLHVERERWDEATSAFAKAGDAAQVLLADVELNEQELRTTLRQMVDLAALAPYVFVASGELDRALQAAESARARLLAKTLTLEALPLRDEDLRRLESLQEEIEKLEARLESPLLMDRMPPLEAVMECREELNGFIGEQTGPEVDELIEMNTADGSVLVFPFLTNVGSALVVVYSEAGRTRVESLRFEEDLTVARVFRASETVDDTWRSDYFTYQQGRSRQNLAAWNRTLRAVGRTLRGAFAEPLSQILDRCNIGPGARLHVLAQGALGNLPLALAQTSDAQEALIDRYEISLCPSLRILAASKKRREHQSGARSLALHSYGKELEFTGFAAEAIRSRFEPVDHNGGTHIEKATLIEMLKTSNVWHFSSHGKFEASAPGRSGIELVEGERLTVDDLMGSRGLAKPSLVTLAACMTGLYDQEDLPNEFIGLPAAFLQAGAAGVVGTLWPVHDDVTALFFSRFYEYTYGNKEHPSAALRSTQLWLRDSSAEELIRSVRRWSEEDRVSTRHATAMIDRITGRDRDWKRPPGPPYSDPHFWSGFVHYGA